MTTLAGIRWNPCPPWIGITGRLQSESPSAIIGIRTLTVVMEMPGVEKKDLGVSLENDVLRVDGRIDFSKYEGMEPVYTEYNIGHYTRSFTLSNKIDQEKISAQLEDGVLTLTLPKGKDALPRQIAIE